MAKKIESKLVEACVREALGAQGFSLNVTKKNGETGVDILAHRKNEDWFIEVIGYKSYGPARSKDFYESFFRAISRLNDGARRIAIALPSEFKLGFDQRVNNCLCGWSRIGKAFPEIEIWFVNTDQRNFERKEWNECIPGGDRRCKS
jgi:hypothetical protein